MHWEDPMSTYPIDQTHYFAMHFHKSPTDHRSMSYCTLNQKLFHAYHMQFRHYRRNIVDQPANQYICFLAVCKGKRIKLVLENPSLNVNREWLCLNCQYNIRCIDMPLKRVQRVSEREVMCYVNLYLYSLSQ